MIVFGIATTFSYSIGMLLMMLMMLMIVFGIGTTFSYSIGMLLMMLMMLMMLMIVFGIGTTFSYSIGMLLVLRLLSGVGMMGILVTSFVLGKLIHDVCFSPQIILQDNLLNSPSVLSSYCSSFLQGDYCSVITLQIETFIRIM